LKEAGSLARPEGTELRFARALLHEDVPWVRQRQCYARHCMRWRPSAAISWSLALSLVTLSSCADEGTQYIIFASGGASAGGNAGAGATHSGGEAGAETSAGRGGGSSGGSTAKGGASGSAGTVGSGGDSTPGGASGSGGGGTSASGGSGPGCSGTPVPCDDIEDVNNGCKAGCTDAYACLGTPRACSTWTNSSACTSYGCDWNSGPDICEGLPYYQCEDFTGGRLDCLSGPGCGWYECLGTALPCEGLDSVTCQFNPGCTWQ